MNDAKQQVLDEIRRNVDIFKKVSPIQYVIRCPVCGDSQSNPRDAHCYIKCSFDPNEPLLYNCFKCPAGGKVTPWFLSKLNVRKDVIDLIANQKYNRIMSIKENTVDMITGTPVMGSLQCKYIEGRLGPGFTYDDYDRFKIVWDIESVMSYISSERIKHTMPSNDDSISFISDDKLMVLNRTFLEDDSRSQWRKIRIIPGDQKSFYTIKTTMNLFTSDEIVVNIAEGVFDILSVYKNFNDCENSVFIATLGSDYISALDYAIAKGFLGTNVIVRFYLDDNINEKVLKGMLKKYKWLFGGIYMYKNILWKDVGVDIGRIKLSERRI